MSENKPVLIALVLTGLALVGLAGYFLLAGSDDEEVVSEPVPIVATPSVTKLEEVMPEPEAIAAVDPTPEDIVIPEVQPETPAFVLPRLDSSDQLIRDGAVSLTRHEGINAWLGSDELIRKTVVFVDNIANGNIAKEPAAALAPNSPMAVTEIEKDVYLVDERSYDRFNKVTSILLSIDSQRSVEFYLLLKPLFAEAFKELGYPEEDFDAVILRAVGRLLETPTLAEPARLVRPVVMFEYEDEKLESLSPAQKQLLRLGPKNAGLVKTKLGELARELRSAIE